MFSKIDEWFRNIMKCFHPSKKKSIYDKHTIPSWIAFIILAIGLLLFFCVYINYESLPTPLKIQDEINHPNRFIAERAEIYLKNLTRIGVRVGGSYENDVLAVNYLRGELAAIKNNINSTILSLDIETQYVGGEFELEFSPYGMTTIYRGVPNVLARLRPANNPDYYSHKCLLLNSHFDTMPDTEGASDAGIMIAILMEILRKMSTSETPLRHCLIFLFNGGEENYMLGSHGFIQHRWFSSVAAFLNLDASGSGGREILFQAGPQHSWLMWHYRNVAPRPHASAMAEELFQKNLIPSDSDFRIFRDFGEIPGMDFAINANGFVYHTKYDMPDIIPSGTFQHTGDNLLAVVKQLAENSYELYNVTSYEDGNAIFYDYLGWFMIYYSVKEGIVINYVISAIGILVIAFALKSMSNKAGLTMMEILSELGAIFIIQILSIGLGAGFAFFLAFFYDIVDRSLSWYSNPWLLFGLYFCPFYLGLGIGPVFWIKYFKKGLLSISHKVQLFLHAQCLIYILLLILMTALEIRSAFVIIIGLTFYLASTFINAATGLQNKYRSWIYTHLIFQIFPLMYYSSLIHLAFQTFIPITGRDGPDSNPEILITVFSIAFGLFCGAFIIPLIALCRSPRIVLSGFGVLTVVSIIIMATPVGFPYRTALAPQRYWIFHTERQFHNLDDSLRRNESGYFLQSMDRHTPKSVEDIVPGINQAQKTSDDCVTELYCGLPLLSSRKHSKSDQSYWISTNSDVPIRSIPTELTLLESTMELENNTKTLKFSITGPNHMGLFISPAKNIKMIDWTFLKYIPESGPLWKDDRPTYFVFIHYGYSYSSTFNFTITLKASSPEWPNETLDIALTSHYLFHQSERTKKFKEFLNTFPEWTYLQAWTSSYESWKF